MAEANYDDFLSNIRRVLSKNGFPEKRVALSLERMYEAAHEKKLNFNKALEMLDAEGIAHEKTDTKIIFMEKPETLAATDPLAAFAGFDPEALRGVDMSEMVARADQMLKSMPPEQLAQIEALYRGMSDEQKAEMMKRAKDMGLI